MHPRNPYITPPSFSQLADDVPALKPYITLNAKGGVTIDFKDPEAVRTLTKALLLRDFGRQVQLPDDRLCPPVSGRLDYVLYMLDIAACHRQIINNLGQETTNDTIGLDIGVGASAVYPLLATALDPKVCMIGTDINATSLDCAVENVQLNQLENRIHLVKTSAEDGFFDAILNMRTQIDFTMCNPPFYESQDEMDRLTAEKRLPPSAICTGAPNEMVTTGGEEAFVSRMIRESQQHGQYMRRFSSLLGKATSVIRHVNELHDLGCSNYGLIESSPSTTHRWILVWSWTDIRLPDHLSRVLEPSSPLTKSLPLPNELSYFCPAHLDLLQATHTLMAFLYDLDLVQAQVPDSESAWLIQAQSVSWTRAARRAAKQNAAPNTNNALLLACAISFKQGSEAGSQVEFHALWKRGRDRQAFESFFSTCVRKLAMAHRQ